MKGSVFVLVCILSCVYLSSILAGSTAYNSVYEKQMQSFVARATEQIETLEMLEMTDSEKLLDIYNERGICLFILKDYDNALNDFNHILNIKLLKNQAEDLIVGSALFGRALCDACLDKTEDTLQDFDLLSLYFSHQFQGNCGNQQNVDSVLQSPYQHSLDFTVLKKPLNDVFILPVARFANPQEHISAQECRERVRGSAQAMKLFIGPLIKDYAKRSLFLNFIDGLERQGIYCCKDGTIWTTCVAPLLDRLHKWKMLGIPADPAWD